MQLTADKIKKMISVAIPEGRVVTAHNEFGHFYKIVDDLFPDGVTYPSVTGKLQILKDEGLINYKMNRALDHVFAHWKEFTEANIMELLDAASKTSADILEDAGDIGTTIHDAREEFFKEWIKLGRHPGVEAKEFLPPDCVDIRAVSALRALDKFINDFNYVPLATELLVYDHKLKVGGMLDDLGFMTDEAGNRKFVLMDIKSSNQFKDHYFFQVALYYYMFYRLTKLRPQRCFILKLSKTDGTYKIEDLYRPSTLASYARSMVRTHNGLGYIRSLRKDNQKTVITI
jgi:hypothetical protein